jgi:hypothetical protein
VIAAGVVLEPEARSLSPEPKCQGAEVPGCGRREAPGARSLEPGAKTPMPLEAV